MANRPPAHTGISHLDQETQDQQAARERAEQEARTRADASAGIAIGKITEGSRIMFALKDGMKFYIDPFPGSTVRAKDGEPMDPATLKAMAGRFGNIVYSVVDRMNQFIQAAQKIHADRGLSSYGRANALEPLQKDLAQTVAFSFDSVMKLRKAADHEEATMLKVPDITNGYEAPIDIEIRTWWRGLDQESRTQQLHAMLHDPAQGRVLTALMRSPIPGNSAEMEQVFEIWSESRRSVNPAKALAIDTDKEAAEWAMNALRMAAAVIVSIVGMKVQDLLTLVLADESAEAEAGAQVFAAPPEIARVQMLMRARSMALS